MRRILAILLICIVSSASSLLDFQFTEYHEGSINPKFNMVKNYGSSKVFVKMTARFRLHRQQKDPDASFFATYWTPGRLPMIQPSKINALIFVSHGYAEYLSNDYDEIARHWSSQVGGGALVFGHDHAGHGRTTVTEEARALVTDMRNFTTPIIAHIREIKRLTKIGGREELPVFIAGYSLGGLISLDAILENPALFDGFIGIGPLVKISAIRDTPQHRALVKFMGKFWPSFNHPLISGLDVKLITRDENKWEDMDNDPLRYHGGTKAGMEYLMFQETDRLQKNLGRIELPILVLQGESDQIVNPIGARMLFNKANSNDREYKGYPGAYHQLLVELQDVRDDVMERTTLWLNRRMS